jgi:hypothetical protein
MEATIRSNQNITATTGAVDGTTAAIKRNQTISVAATPSGGLVQSAPITLKNSIQENTINTIEAIGDVDEVNVTDGATLIYNSVTDKYEIKLLSSESISGIDGGTF